MKDNNRPRIPLSRFSWPVALVWCVAATTACHPPWHPIPTFDDDTTGSESEGSGASASDGSASGSGSASGTTGSTSSDPTQGTDGDDPTEGTGEPALPPEIVDVMVTPQPMPYQGPIAVEVQTILGATGVSLLLEDGGVAQELAVDAGDPAHFHGVIPALSGTMNGEHLALLTPWATAGDGETIVGATVEVPYTLSLPEPGSELLWEASDLLGKGEVAGLAHTTSGELIEFGTETLGGSARCYLRRRDKSGAWKATDVHKLLPGEDCKATDLAVAPTGEIFILAQRQTQNGIRWWLGELSAWGALPKNRMFGQSGEEAAALARHGSGMIAVCGSVPTVHQDQRDAAAWLLRPNLPGESRSFDYQAEISDPHWFAETTRDCAFAGDTLVLVGDAFGQHDLNDDKWPRHFVLEFQTLTKATAWTVADGEFNLQSVATAIAIDDLGRSYVAGYTCGNDCNHKPVAELWVHDPGGTLISQSPIGVIPNPNWAPRALAWSPAGYAVVALGGSQGAEVAFTVRAYSPQQLAPLWTYSRSDHPFLNFAYAVSVGPFGEIVAGGLGMSGYPAVAYIAG